MGKLSLLKTTRLQVGWLEVDYGEFGLQKEVLTPGQFIERYDINELTQDFIWSAVDYRVFDPPVFLELTKIASTNST